MIIVERQTDIAGRLRVLVEIDNTLSIPLKYQSNVSDEIIFADAQKYIDFQTAQRELDSWQPVEFSILKNEDLIVEFITQIKANPTITLTQYNTWLSKKTWNESAIIRYFVYQLAIGLSEKYDVVLANKTETTVLGKVRDWIVNTPNRKLRKIIFNT